MRSVIRTLVLLGLAVTHLNAQTSFPESMSDKELKAIHISLFKQWDQNRSEEVDVSSIPEEGHWKIDPDHSDLLMPPYFTIPLSFRPKHTISCKKSGVEEYICKKDRDSGSSLFAIYRLSHPKNIPLNSRHDARLD